MKKSTLLFIAVAGVFSVGCFAQSSTRDNANRGNAQLMSDRMSDNDVAIVSYHVEERINMAFGGRITTYDVSNISLVGTNDLGASNTRVVTPKYGKVRAKIAAVDFASGQPKAQTTLYSNVVFPPKYVRIPPKFVNIDILSTYERVIDRGYKTVEMLKKVGNGRYYDGDLIVAAKWYTQLFEMTSDLEAEYYFRYAKSLDAINQSEKASEMMAIFENKK